MLFFNLVRRCLLRREAELHQDLVGLGALVLKHVGESLVALALADGLSDEILFRRLVGGRPLYHVRHLLRRRRVSRLDLDSSRFRVSLPS